MNQNNHLYTQSLPMDVDEQLLKLDHSYQEDVSVDYSLHLLLLV
jgi:hypothetical protein